MTRWWVLLCSESSHPRLVLSGPNAWFEEDHGLPELTAWPLEALL